MRILFFKALPPADLDEDQLEPPDKKMLGILQEHVRRAKTEEERDWAQRELDEFVAGKRRLATASSDPDNLT